MVQPEDPLGLGRATGKVVIDLDGLVERFQPDLLHLHNIVNPEVLAWAAERGFDLSEAYFYSDSFSDAPMLRVVGHPRVISPDPRLNREARQRGWPILQW